MKDEISLLREALMYARLPGAIVDSTRNMTGLESAYKDLASSLEAKLKARNTVMDLRAQLEVEVRQFMHVWDRARTATNSHDSVKCQEFWEQVEQMKGTIEERLSLIDMAVLNEREQPSATKTEGGKK